MRSVMLALVRGIKLLDMLSVLGRLYIGYINRDMNFELATLGIGAGLFYLSVAIQRHWRK